MQVKRLKPSLSLGSMAVSSAAIMALCLPLLSAPAIAAPTSLYSKLTDEKTCKVTEKSGEEGDPEFASYVCPGPVKAVQTKLDRGGDYDHLHLLIDGKSYSLWGPMLEVGGFSGLRGENPLGEWVFSSVKPRNRANLIGFIVRFDGAQLNADGNFSNNQSKLSVISLTKGKICWKGNADSNADARAMLANGACKTTLSPE